jgi:uncharacterized membrane protein required for colicin V production
MSFLLTLLLLVMLFACVALGYSEGLWTNAIRLINLLTAALLATNFFEPVAAWMESIMRSATYLCDFIALWVLFIVFSVILGELTDRVSRVAVKFPKIVDQIGSGVLSVWIGYVLVCFTLMSLHMAPLSQNFLFGGFQPGGRMFMGLAPDRDWLGFMHKMSTGTFYRSDANIFDPQADFIPKYDARRKALEEQIDSRNTLLASGY